MSDTIPRLHLERDEANKRIKELEAQLQDAQQNAAEIRRSITPEEHANIPQILHDIAHVSGLGEEAIRILRYMRHTEDLLRKRERTPRWSADMRGGFIK